MDNANDYQTTRIWKKTLKTLKLIAAMTDSSIVETMDRLASQELVHIERKDTNMENQQKQGEPEKKYTGFIEAPKVFSTLENGMVSTGVDLWQCPDCGYWMSKKMSPSDEREHDRQCRPRW